MEKKQEKLKSFRDLRVWQEAAELAVLIYKITARFPSSELYGLVSQLRRASISVSSNIAEGFKRVHINEKLQFYNVAHASIAEVESQIEVGFRLGLVSRADCDIVLEKCAEISKMMYKFISSLSSKFYVLSSMPRASRAGFTLVELVVAIGLFSLLVSIALGGFIQALRSERQTVALLSANSNVSLIVEQMAREIRTATNFSASSGELRFTSAKGEAVTYCRNSATQAIERVVSGICGSGQQLTSRNVAVRGLDFIASGISPGDLYPPRITIRVSLSATGDPGVESSVINLQTTVSARNL